MEQHGFPGITQVSFILTAAPDQAVSAITARCEAGHAGQIMSRRKNPLGFSSNAQHGSLYDQPVMRAIGAVVARFVHTEEVTGSNPVSPTIKPQGRGAFPKGEAPRMRCTYKINRRPAGGFLQQFEDALVIHAGRPAHPQLAGWVEEHV